MPRRPSTPGLRRRAPPLVLAGLVGVIALGVAAVSLLGPAASTPTATGTAGPGVGRPSATRRPEPLPLSLSFVSGQRAVQVPVGVLRVASPDLGAVPELAAAPSGGGLLIALPAAVSEPLRAARAGGPELLVVYVGLDERVTAVARPAAGDTAAAVPPYALALVAPRSAPHVGEIVVGDRALVDEDLRALLGLARPPPVPVPPRGTLAPYPAAPTGAPAPRPTALPAYPGKG